MSILTTPVELIGRGGSNAVSGVLRLAMEVLILFCAVLAIQRLATFSWTKKVRVTGRVTRKYMVPERREWQGKAYVTVPEKISLEIDVEHRCLQFSPVPWKYDRVSEGDEIDVALQRGRFGNEIRILDIEPF